LNRSPVVRAARALFPAAAAVLLCLTGPLPATAQPSPSARDGAHDFDFNVGVWKSQIRRTANPLSGGDQVVELNGTVTVRKVWGGRALLEEIEADGPGGHWEGMTVFLYNPRARQWNQSFANSTGGVLDTPTIGSFKDGRGEFYATDTFEGRAILVRGAWFEITSDAHRYEESYSDDGGRTWHVAFSSRLTRLAQ
jgi:uncharacterized protein DUF1579